MCVCISTRNKNIYYKYLEVSFRCICVWQVRRVGRISIHLYSDNVQESEVIRRYCGQDYTGEYPKYRRYAT